MAKNTNSSLNAQCFCGTADSYSKCCHPYISYQELPETALQLMRSRYSAYVMLDIGYLLSSWHENFRPKDLSLDKESKWLGLKILNIEQGGNGDQIGYVSFVARYRHAGVPHRVAENSYFEKHQSKWFYCRSEHNDS